MPVSRAQIYAALQKADAAGNTDDAKQLAQMYAAAPADNDTPGSEVNNAVDTLKNNVRTALAGVKAPAGPPQVNGPMAPSLSLGDIVGHIVHGQPLPDGALPTDHLMHWLAGGDNGTGEVHPDTPGGKAAIAADSVTGNMVDLPVSAVRAGLRKTTGMSHDTANTVVNTGLMVAPALGPMAGDAAALGSDALGGAKTALQPVADVATAGKRADAMAGQMNDAAQTALKGQQAREVASAASNTTDAAKAQSTGQAQAAEIRAQAQARANRLNSIAAKARQRGNDQFAQRAEAAAQSAAPEPDIGTPGNASDLGDAVRDPALANEDGINTRMRAMDDQLRSAMDQVATEQEAKGVGVSDMPLAKQLIKSSSDIVSPDPINRPNVGNVPADSAGAKLHKMVLDALSPTYIPLDADMVGPVKAKGGRVVEQNGSTFRVIPPSLQNVDELRRTLGQAASGNLEGYGAINKIEARNLYGKVSDLMDQYAQGTSKPVQANWQLGKAALQPYEKLKMGKTLVGLQNGTSEPAVASAAIPGRIIAGGRDAIDQASMVAGPGPVQSMLRSHVQNEFAGKNAGQLTNMVAPGTKLGDAISTNSDLLDAVRQHIANVANAEQFGAKATDLASRSATNMGRADKLSNMASKTTDQYGQVADQIAAQHSKIAEQLTGQAAKATDNASSIERQVAGLEIADPKTVGPQYTKVLANEHAAGRITDGQYRDGLTLAQQAETAFKLKATRDKWLGEASWLAGGGALGGTFGGPAGFALGIGAGHLARTIRHGIGKKMGGL